MKPADFYGLAVSPGIAGIKYCVPGTQKFYNHKQYGHNILALNDIINGKRMNKHKAINIIALTLYVNLIITIV